MRHGLSLLIVLIVCASAERCGGNGSATEGGPCEISGPRTPADQSQWLKSLTEERRIFLQRTGYAGGVWDVPSLRWSRYAYIQPQMHPFDLKFYDVVTGKYSVDLFLADLEGRYGAIDAALVWPTYPNLGADDRNQFDMWRSLPGGLDAIKAFTSALRDRGVHVLWAYLQWDTGTRAEGKPDTESLVSLLELTGGSGFNGDSLPFVPQEYYQASTAANYPLTLQAEGCARDEALRWSTTGWGYWGRAGHDDDPAGYNWTYATVPLVDRFKWVTSSRWLTTICERYRKNKTDDLQLAWFNGNGYVSWENVWGAWNGVVPRDGEAIRRLGIMLRWWGAEGLLYSPDWEPHAAGPTSYGVYASRWPLGDRTLWTLVNRAGKDQGAVRLELAPGTEVDAVGQHVYDCYHGKELTPSSLASRAGSAVHVTIKMEAGGFGCVVVQPNPADERLRAHLRSMARLTARPLSSFDAAWRYLQQQMVAIPMTKRAPTAPAGMVRIPKARYAFHAEGIEIEGRDALGVDVQFPWESSPRRVHTRNLTLGPFFIDRHPVTCANYTAYLSATGYRPRSAHNWLKNWRHSSNTRTAVDDAASPSAAHMDPPVLPAELADVPVTYVGIAEARAYCAWVGGRLPHSYEWQYAAQGLDNRSYPWGRTHDTARYPPVHTGRTFLGPPRVGEHSPAGDSPFGVADLVGSVWQYTDEFGDAHTRRAVLRGGSNYRPAQDPPSTDWYFPNSIELHTHQKWLLMDDSFERCGTIGFRCVVDAAAE